MVLVGLRRSCIKMKICLQDVAHGRSEWSECQSGSWNTALAASQGMDEAN